MKPSQTGKNCKLVGGKTEWTYSEVDKDHPAVWNVKGPRNYSLLTRIALKQNGEFTLYVDGKVYKTVKLDGNKASKYSIRVGDGKPFPVSDANIVRLKVEKGTHALKLVSNGALFVRLVKVPAKAKYIAPESYLKTVVLVSGDIKTTYYAGTKEKPVVFKFNGQGNLTVYSRLAYNATMKGIQHYTVVADVDGKPLRYKLETDISQTSTLQNDKSLIAGKSKTVKIKLAKGNHVLKFWHEETIAPYVAYRFSVGK
jgi:hypothetical protein